MVRATAVPDLPPRYARVLELHLAGLGHHEIATKLGINYNTARSRLGRAIQETRRQLEPVDVE